TTLVYSMIDILSGNIARGNKNLKLYEIGRRYLQTGKVVEDGIIEPETLMIAQSGEGYDFYTLKAVIENIASLLNIDLTYSRNSEPFLHPGRQAEILLDGKYIGFIGEVHPQTAGAFKCEARLLVAQLDLDTMLENAKLFKPYKGISRFPAVSRDLAFVIDADTYAGELLDCVKVAAGELLESIKVFDVYAGKGVPDGKKSVALALSFRAEERTLKDKEIVEIVNKILNDVYAKLGGTLRE
ncbi:MAG: phenylalanine--tRNA ligase subunit beta, partial [Clostridia bacterium]|nr:phenylalanine--tRNA ligase subunit beta [Clostridia bacterium]